MEMKNGIYLILDPAMEQEILLERLKMVVREKITAVQIWDNFQNDVIPHTLINDIITVCHAHNIPVLINNRWELLKKTQLDGIHFDSPPAELALIGREIGRPFLAGVTCNNDLSVVRWAHENGMDYISFCSMFPSSTANSCELVSFETVQKAREITPIPLFLAGGIRPENAALLNGLDYTGIAVVSGVMKSETPDTEIRKYLRKLKF